MLNYLINLVFDCRQKLSNGKLFEEFSKWKLSGLALQL